METKGKKNNNLYIRMLISILGFAVFAIAVLGIYSFKMDNLNKSTLYEQVTVDTAQYSMQLQQELVYLDKTLKPVVDVLETGEISEEEAVQILLDNTKACQTAVLDAEGNGIDAEGNRVSIDAGTFVGTLKRGICTYYYDDADGILALTPVVTESGIVKIIMMRYEVSGFNGLFSNFNFGSEAWLLLVDKNGEIAYCFSKKPSSYLSQGDNFFDILSESEGRIITMMDEVSRKQAGNKEIVFGEDTRQVFYKSVGIDDWYVFVGIPESYINTSLNQKRAVVREMLICIMVGIVLFVAVLVIGNIRDKRRGKVKNEGLVQLAETDQLTGLYNKVTTEKKIKEFIEENPDTQSLFFVLDIDNFKKINDTLGHAFGDEVLRTIGQRIRMEFRASDIIGRAGGDEFIILLKGLKSDEIIVQEAKKVEEFFKGFEAGTYVKYAATASIGCAVFPRDAADFDSLYKAADQALYLAKKRGKNQLAFYKEPEGFGQSV